jgi:phosphatidylglycerol---prolipoprotein diacylglyceryl transferase
MDPVAIHLGPLAIRWYGIMIVLGVILAAYVASIEAKRRGENPDHVWNALLIVLICGIVGARLYHVFSSPAGGSLGWSYYRQNPLAIFQIWKGGLAIYGAVAGGAIGLWLYVRWSKLSFLRWVDIVAPGVILAQAVGRWGNFFNQELYGPPTDLPWGITIAPQYRLPGFESFSKFHPVFLYESLFCLIGFILLMVLARRAKTSLLDGDVFFAYMIYYPAGRFFIEFLRPDAWKFGGIAAAQVFALILVAAGAAAIVLRHTVLRPPATASALAVSDDDQSSAEAAGHADEAAQGSEPLGGTPPSEPPAVEPPTDSER